MSDIIRNYLDELEAKAIRWRIFCRDYASAYHLAHDQYKATWAAQEKSDKEKAEMIVLALSVASSTVLMAAFATNSLRVLASRAALNVICNNNLNRTFNALHLVSNNKAAMFALGAVMDAADAKAKKYIEEKAGTLTRSAPTPAVTNPAVLQNDLINYVESNQLYAMEVAFAIRDDKSLSEAERAILVGSLKKAPLFKPPVNEIRRERLTDHIELSLHMSAMLDSDFLVDIPMREASLGGGIAAALGTREKPIPQLPSAPDYPRGTPSRSFLGGVHAQQMIRVARPGDVVQAKIDELNGRIFNEKFFSANSWQGGQNGPMPVLLRAETTLNRLAEASRPLQLDSARV